MGDRYLVLDSRTIETADNARLAVTAAEKDSNNPLFGEDKPWEIRFDNFYPNVMYDQQDELYKCWYSPFIVDKSAKGMKFEERQKKYTGPNNRETGVSYATSKDGIAWDKPELGIIEFEGSKKNNLVCSGRHGTGVFKDLREKDPAKRYKMFTSAEEKDLAVSFSPDGIQWGPLSLCRNINPVRVDGTHYNALWVDELGEYVGFTRLRGVDGNNLQAKNASKRSVGSKTLKKRRNAWPPRQVGRTTSKDFVNWTQAKLIMQGLDDNLQIYSMPVFRHGSVYIGLPVIHNQRTDRAWTELAWSADTVEWHRVCPGSPLIPNSDPVGSYDWGCAYSPAYPILLENEIRLYYGASNLWHTGWRDGFLCLARLRPDGFAGYEQVSGKRPAVVTTAPVVCTGSGLHLSADVQSIGSVRVRLLDRSNEQLLAESEPIEKTVTDGVVEWQKGFSINALRAKDVRVQFIVNGAKLYSFGFDL